MKKLIYLLPVLAALSACGGGGGGGTAGDTTAGNPAPPPVSTAPMIDAFYNLVNAIVGMSSETAEPAALDGSAASMPENTDPSPVS